MPRPDMPPIGLELARTAKAVSRAFDAALAAAGGSTPVWLILISLKTERRANQRALAEAVGIQDATLTHHLNSMEADGLLTRQRDPSNRRVHNVDLSKRGEALFEQLRTAATAFDRRLRADIPDEDIEQLRGLLARLRATVSQPSTLAPWS
jgi:MarR family transcriptional regulator for hemolysin